MKLIYIAALIAVCSAAKLDRSYLPPASSKTAGGSDDLQTPHFRDSFEPGRNGLPKGAEENEFEGVVVEAAAPGTRQSGSGESGLGGPRLSYGSAHSKVGEAAFRIKQQQRPDDNTNTIAGQNNFQTSQVFYPGASSDFKRPYPGTDQLDSQVPHGIDQGAPSDLNRPRPVGEQSESQTPHGIHRGTPSNFNKPQPAADQANFQVSHGFQKGTPSDFNRPRPAGEQSVSQAPHDVNQGAPSNFNSPQSAADQTDFQVSHGFQQESPSDFNRLRPAGEQSGSQKSQSFQKGAPSHFNRLRPAADQAVFQVSQGFQQGTPSDFNRPRPTGDLSDLQTPQSYHHGTPSNFIRQRPQSAFDRTSNTVRIENNVGSQAYNYGYETENGITAEEHGVNINGVQAQGGFSYTGDDGKFYKITYTAGEGGYQPVGDHLPTPPPIPDEILKSIEQNAKEEAGGPEDDGSYDAAKYNAEDDYTKSDISNSRPAAFGNKPASEGDVSGTFINQNNRPFASFSNNNRQKPTYVHIFSEQHSSNLNNSTSTQDGTESYNNKLTQNPSTNKFVPSTSKGDETFMQFGLPDSEKNLEPNTQDEAFGPGDYSRPIDFGLTQLDQISGNRFGNKHHDLPSSNYFIQNQANSMPSDTIQTELSSPRESQSISEISNLVMKNQNNINQQNVGSQDGSQILSNSNKHTDNIESSRNPNFPEKQLSSYPSIHSTLQPNLELSTPYEYYSFSNTNINNPYQNQNQNQGSFSHPTQQSFSSQISSDPQSSSVTNSEFKTSNTDANSQLHNSNSPKDSNYLQKLPFVEQQMFNINSQDEPKQDQSYYYNQPSITFNPYVRPTYPTFTRNKNGNRFSNSFPTKYPSPPTVATIFSSIFPGRNMYNENSNNPQSFIPQNNGLGAATKYPEPPSLGHIIPVPTSPTSPNGENFFAQHAGLTQASVSPFPSISPLKHNSNYNSQPIETTRQNVSPNSESTTFQQETNDKPDSDSQAPNIPTLSTIGEKTKPSQQYNGEVYEYKKPTETLITPTESDESIQQNSFPQFGQKLKPSTSQSDSNANQINKQHENNMNQKYPSTQESLSLAGATPLTESQNFQTQFSSQATPESNNAGFNNDNREQTGPSSNVYPTVHEQRTQSSQISSGPFTDVQTTPDYNGPFGFSSRIRPCCQGPRRIPTDKTPDRQTGNNFQNSVPFGHQNTNLRPDFESGKPGSTHSTVIQNGLKNAQTTSQSLFIANGEEFDGARKPPSFNDATGYHYK